MTLLCGEPAGSGVWTRKATFDLPVPEPMSRATRFTKRRVELEPVPGITNTLDLPYIGRSNVTASKFSWGRHEQRPGRNGARISGTAMGTVREITAGRQRLGLLQSDQARSRTWGGWLAGISDDQQRLLRLALERQDPILKERSLA